MANKSWILNGKMEEIMSSIDVLIYSISIVILTPVALVLLGILSMVILLASSCLVAIMISIKEQTCKLFKCVKMIMGNK